MYKPITYLEIISNAKKSRRRSEKVKINEKLEDPGFALLQKNKKSQCLSFCNSRVSYFFT
jgi:hypothetical protein